jgi:signal transduction histidine kinase
MLGIMNQIFSSAALLALAGASLFYAGRYLWLRREVSRLTQTVRAYYRSGSAPGRAAFYYGEVVALWRLVLLLGARNRQGESTKTVYSEALALSSRLAGAADEESTLAEAIVDTVMKQAKPEVCAAGVILASGADKEFHLKACVGVPQNRLEASLLICLDVLIELETKAAGRSWGYHLAEEGSYVDFSAFGVRLCLVVPLRGASGLCGAIWLGFRQNAEPFSKERKEFLQAIAEHAAASFFAARKSQEKTERSNRERDFLLGLSHDLRSPGNAALLAARELLSGDLGELGTAQRKQIELLEQAISEQLALLGDVLDYAKYQKGFLCAERADVSLWPLTSGLVGEYQQLAEKKGLKFNCQITLDALINVDLRHFKRMLANLLSNAVKYTDEGQINLEFEGGPGFIRVIVADTGIGVRSEDQDNLFREFSRGRNGVSRAGAGLGLALTKVLAELNGGEVFYRPNGNRGSIFGFVVPRGEEGKEDGQAAGLRVHRMLVADDDAAACRALIRNLQGLADVFVPAGSVAEVKEAMGQLGADLVISDVNLHDGSVLETVRLAAKRIPVLLITGSAEAQREVRTAEDEQIKVLEKPVSRDVLRAMVIRIISGARKQERSKLAA